MNHAEIARRFDDWAKTGQDAQMELGHGDVVRQVLPRLEIDFGDKILDLGCGNGWATRLLAQAAPGATAVGIDASAEMIARAEALHSLTIRARYQTAHFESLPFKDAHFDRAFSMEALYYAVDLEATLRELARVLKPGAPADLLIDFYADRPGVTRWPEHMGLPLDHRTPEAWVEALEAAGFQAETECVVDSRWPTPSEFEPSRLWPSFEERAAYHAAGTLWLRARRR